MASQNAAPDSGVSSATDQETRLILDSVDEFVEREVADDAVQVHGASGLAEENPFMDHLQYARILRIVEGTDEIQLNTVARQLGVQ